MIYLVKIKMKEKDQKQSELIENIKKIKSCLQSNDLMPLGFHFYKGEENKVYKNAKSNIDSFYLNITFKSEDDFYKWQQEVKGIEEITQLMHKIRNNIKDYNWLAEIV